MAKAPIKSKPDDEIGNQITNPNLDDKEQNAILRQLPGGLEFFETVHYKDENEIIKVAQDLFEDIRKKLGRNTSKPRMKAVENLFYKYAHKPRKVPPAVAEAMRETDHVEKIAVFDRTYDHAVATAVNKFDLTSVDSGSKIQEAYDKWTLAVRIYRSAARSSGAVFKAKIDQANFDYKAFVEGAGGLGQDIRLSEESRYYKRAAEISKGLVVYETDMAKASDALATAFGSLIKDIFSSVSSTATGEAVLVDATQKASLTFWSDVQKELSKSSNRN